eukprot:GHVN01020965.1.p3 GENE.GHVN01020965.1~~GHVN01020965.1.p3  ORF type:complete len:132 (+),score=7.58 GHVN01020965.1:2-397(+)
MAMKSGKSLPTKLKKHIADKKPAGKTTLPNMQKKIHRPKSSALREIRKYQRSTDLLIKKLPFARLLRDIAAGQLMSPVTRWSSVAFNALQEAAEAFLVILFEESYWCSLHGKRVTLMVKDIQLARRIRGPE